MKSKKGQSGLDLLMSYGWVVVIGVIAIILFANLGFMNFGGCDNNKIGFSQAVPVDWEIYPSENKIILKVENWAGDSVEITDFNATMGTVSCKKSPVGVMIDAGEDATLEIECLDGKLSDLAYGGSCYSVQVTMLYSYVYDPGTIFKSVGTVRGRTGA